MKAWKGIALFAGGTLFGLWGIKMLCSKDAKKVYTNCTAGVLRAKDYVFSQATSVKENCEDIYAEAKAINEERAQKAKETEVDDWEDIEAEEAEEEKAEESKVKKTSTKKTASKAKNESKKNTEESKEETKSKKTSKKK